MAILSRTKDECREKAICWKSIYVKSTGLKINAAKTKAMRMNTNNNQPIVNGNVVDDVKHFIYLGTTVSETGGTNEDIRIILGRARLAYNKLN